MFAFRASAREAPLEPANAEPPPSSPSLPPSAPIDASTAPAAEIYVEEGQPTATAEGGLEPGVASAPEEPLEISVVGARPRRAPGSVHVVGARTLQRYKYDDAHAAMQLVPGVYVRQEDGAGLRPNIGIRGAISDRSKKITLLEDGVLFAPAPYSAPAAYYFPLMPRIYQLRVIKGPSAISYGPQTIGGAVDLVTRPIPSSPSGAVDLAVGQYGYGKLHAFAGTSDISTGFLIEGIHVRSDGFKELPSGADTGFQRNEWMFKGSHNFDPTSPRVHELALKLTYSDEISNETYLGLSDADFARNPLARYGASALDRMRWFHTSLVLTHRIDPTPNLSITTNVYRHDFTRSWRKVNHFRGAALFDVLQNPDTPQNSVFYSVLTGQADSSSAAEALYIGPNDRDFASQGIESRFKLDLTSGPMAHKIEYGIRFHNDWIERRHSEDAYDIVAGNLVPEGTPTIVTALNAADSYALSLHALDAITWGALTLTPGVRAELVFSTFEDKIAGAERGSSSQILLPGVGAYFGFTEELGVLAGVYRGTSPTPPGAEEQISPESSVNYEAGVRYSAGRRRAEIIGYYNAYTNLTDVCTFSTGCVNEDLDRQFDAGRARIYGFEAYAEDELSFGPVRLPLSAAYTLTMTEFLQTFESQDPIFGEVEAGDEMPYVPRHQLRANIGVEVGPVAGYVSGTYVSRMREEAGQGPLDLALTTDEQLTFDAGASYALPLPTKVLLYAQARNLFDEVTLASRRPYGARPNPPRWVQVGARLEF